MRWFIVGLVLCLLCLAGDLIVWATWHLFFTPIIWAAAAFVMGVVAWLWPSALVGLRKGILFLAVPLTVLPVAIELAMWRDKAEYRLEGVCDELQVRTTKAGSVTLRPPRFRVAVAEGPGLQLTAKVFSIHADGTSDPDLAAVAGIQQLSVVPLKSSAGSDLPFAAVSVDPDVGPDIKVEWAAPKPGAGKALLRMRWNHAKGAQDALKVAAEPLPALSLQGHDYSLELHNCTVKFGTYERDLTGKATLMIRGEVPKGADTLVLRLDPGGKEPPEFDLNFGVQKDPLHVPLPLPADLGLSDPILDGIQNGQLNVKGGSSTSIKAGSAVEPRIAVVGDAAVESCELQDDGLHISAKGTATEITADAEDQMPSQLTTLLRSPVIMALLFLGAWVIDKLINVYEAVKK